ncbi:hypothetical protein [Gemmatimonas sp.]|uniref:hypothetical protein n=1 Tax=Gemmatimonas sp. TaxID=1962908 RepID=UPI003DA65E93
MSTPQKPSQPSLWRASVGERPHMLQMEERAVGGPIRVKARMNGARHWHPMKDAYVHLPTGQRLMVGDVRIVRSNKGIPTADSVARVRKAGSDIIAELTQGRHPWESAEKVEVTTNPNDRLASEVQPPRFHPHMTLGELAHAARDPRDGRFVGITQSAQSQRWSLRTALEVALATLGPKHAVRATTMDHLRRIWRARARREEERGLDGFRTTENTLAILLATIQWAADDCPELAHKIPPRWRAQFRQDWSRIRGVTVATQNDVEGPRYSPEEMHRIFRGIADRKGPPQVRFAADLGGEQRLGQVAESVRRSHVHLDEGEHGAIHVPNSGRKRGGTQLLSASQRAHLDEEMSHGMLRHVERLYVQGVLKDYALVPRLLQEDGAVAPEKAHLPLMKREAQRMWKLFEAVCGVAYVKGRAWYGMRRWAADAIEAVAKASPDVDARAKAVAQSWDEDSRMPLRYRKRDKAVLQKDAAQLRARARELVLTPTESRADTERCG